MCQNASFLVRPAAAYVSPLPVLRAQNLFPRPEMNTPPSTDRVPGISFPEGENAVF